MNGALGTIHLLQILTVRMEIEQGVLAVIGVAGFVMEGGRLDEGGLSIRGPHDFDFLGFFHFFLEVQDQFALVYEENRHVGLGSVETYLMLLQHTNDELVIGVGGNVHLVYSVI